MRAIREVRHDDRDAAELWQRAMESWHAGCRGLVDWIADEGRLCEGWTREAAADLMWALMSVEFVDDLVTARGWSVDELADRLALLLRRALTD